MFQKLKKLFTAHPAPVKQDSISKAYEEGAQATYRLDGDKDEFCVYARGSPEHNAWYRGFNDAIEGLKTNVW